MKSIKVLSMVIAFVFLCLTQKASAQSCEPLQSASAASGLEGLLSGENKINSACILSESDEHIVVRVAYSGFTDKAYKISGKILNSVRKPLAEFETATLDITKGSTSADLQFEFKKANKTYSKPTIESKFLAIAISSESDPLSGLDIGGASLFGTSGIYKLERQWSTSGGGGDNSGITVNVTLTPYKSAATIKQ